MKKELVPSLLSADFSELQAELSRVEECGITHLHLDVMDGQFVPNISFGSGVIASIRKVTNLVFDCHLMVREPAFLYEALADAGCSVVSVHQEACVHLHRDIQRIHSLGMRAGVALNPATPPECLRYVLDDLDLILVMSVNPGFGGQRFIPQSIGKLRALRSMIDASGRDIVLEVDGGVNEGNMEAVLDAGCDWLVAGSAVFSPKKTRENAQRLQTLLDAYQKAHR